MDSFLLTAVLGLVLLICSAYLFYRWEWRALPVFVPVLAFIVVGYEYVQDIPAFVSPVVLGGAGGYCFKNRKGFGFFLAVSSLSIALINAGNFYYLLNFRDVDLIKVFESEFFRLLNSGGVPVEVKNDITRDYNDWIDMIRDLVPFSSFIYSVFMSSVVFLILKMFFRRMMDVSLVKGLEFFKVNDYIIFIMIGGWLAVLFVDREASHPLYMAGLNAALITGVFYFIQALAVIKFFLMKKNLPVFILPVVLIFIFFTGLPVFVFIAVMLAGLGTLDLWADFRKLSDKKIEI